MKLSIISDVHIKQPGDDASKLLLSFLNNPDVVSSDGIFLLGDVFDLMVGPHSQYFVRFEFFFEILKKLLEQNKKIYYVPGNHDFHLDQLYEKFFKVHKNLDPNLFQLKSEIIIKDGEKSIYMAHGDDVELGNSGQKIFKSVVTSPPLTFVANYLMPYFIITGAGEYSSEKSRNRNINRYSQDSDVSGVKENFRKSAEEFNRKNPHDIIVLGHSHVQDHYISENKFQYVNNGYAQNTKTYISIENGNISFKRLAT
jgi:UDP-2,3-diacylglucosamine hydrolase